jgi:hypothetical protein
MAYHAGVIAKLMTWATWKKNLAMTDRRDCALADLHQFQPTHTGAGNKLLHSTIVAMNVVFKEFGPPDAEPAVLAIK